MKDRVSLYPGRVLITPEDGSPAFYATMTRADEPTQAGDPLNKATLLSDSVAAMYGLDGATVPNDLFGYVGEYAQHQWFRKVVPNIVAAPSGSYTTLLMLNSVGASINQNFTFYDNVELNYKHEVFLSGDKTNVSVTYNDRDNLYNAVGKYFEHGGIVYYMDSESVVTGAYENGYNVYLTAREMRAEDRTAPGPDTYLKSSDENAYPHSGESGGYAYTYLGRSMEHVLREPVRIIQGSYYGTGEFGASAPNRLAFPFKKLLALFVAPDSHSNDLSLVYLGQHGRTNSGSVFTDTDNGLEWYGEDAFYQANEDGVLYQYLAVGIDTDRKEN